MSRHNGRASTELVARPLSDDDVYAVVGTTTESEHLRGLRARVAERRVERDLLCELVDVDGDPVFNEVREPDEREADKRVARTIRERERRERKRAGKAGVRRARKARYQRWWDERAERTRERILDPARSLGSDHRRWVLSATMLFLLLVCGVLYMAFTVHDGLVGVGGSWIGYLVEPLASVLLVVSLAAQFTGRQRGIDVPGRFVAFDIGLAVVSLVLNTVPYGLRYGFDAGSLSAHVFAPLLVVGAVIGWHMAGGLYGEAIARSKDDPVLRERLALLRRAIASGALSPDVSANGVIKYLRETLPGGIGHVQGRRVARFLLGY